MGRRWVEPLPPSEWSTPSLTARIAAADRAAAREGALLSHRELEIVGCVARGLSNKEVAVALECSEQTVKNHMTHILGKLGVADRTAAVVRCLTTGIITIDGLELTSAMRLQAIVQELRGVLGWAEKALARIDQHIASIDEAASPTPAGRQPAVGVRVLEEVAS